MVGVKTVSLITQSGPKGVRSTRYTVQFSSVDDSFVFTVTGHQVRSHGLLSERLLSETFPVFGRTETDIFSFQPVSARSMLIVHSSGKKCV